MIQNTQVKILLGVAILYSIYPTPNITILGSSLLKELKPELLRMH